MPCGEWCVEWERKLAKMRAWKHEMNRHVTTSKAPQSIEQLQAWGRKFLIAPGFGLYVVKWKKACGAAKDAGWERQNKWNNSPKGCLDCNSLLLCCAALCYFISEVKSWIQINALSKDSIRHNWWCYVRGPKWSNRERRSRSEMLSLKSVGRLNFRPEAASDFHFPLSLVELESDFYLFFELHLWSLRLLFIDVRLYCSLLVNILVITKLSMITKAVRPSYALLIFYRGILFWYWEETSGKSKWRCQKAFICSELLKTYTGRHFPRSRLRNGIHTRSTIIDTHLIK